MSKKHGLYTGRSGHFVVMAEFLYRGYNVAIPEVDVGDDIFVVKDDDGTHRSFHILESWSLGGRLFHTPIWRAIRLGKVGKPIKGLVKHARVNARTARWSLHFLILIFDVQRLPSLLSDDLRFSKINSFFRSIRCLIANISNEIEDWRIRIGLGGDNVEHADAAIMHD